MVVAIRAYQKKGEMAVPSRRPYSDVDVLRPRLVLLCFFYGRSVSSSPAKMTVAIELYYDRLRTRFVYTAVRFVYGIQIDDAVAAWCAIIDVAVSPCAIHIL